MPSKKLKKTALVFDASSSLQKVADPQVAVDFALPIMRDELKNQKMGFTRLKNADVFELTGQGQESAEARGLYAVHQLPDKLQPYWIALRIAFEYVDPGFNIHSIQIVAFTGERFSTKIPILRAEWDLYSGLSKTHGQPHWHVYQDLASESIQSFEEGEASSFVSANNPSSAFDNQKFHYAMICLWHKLGENAHFHLIENAGQLRNWLRGCIRYISSQLN